LFSAAPAPGYTFGSWSGILQGKPASASASVTGSASVTANFLCDYSNAVATQLSVFSGVSTPAIAVSAGAACPWSAVSQAGWMTITSGSSGNGTGVVSVSVQANPGTTPRSGTLTVAGASIAITQRVPLTTPEAFVSQQYVDLLDRVADTAGLNCWAASIKSGSSRETAASAIFSSPESESLGIYLSKLYLGALQRDADYQGWVAWYGAMRSGQSQSAVAGSFIASPEGQRLYGGLNDNDFVEAIYRIALNRPADSAGLQGWTNQLKSGGTRGAVVAGIITSGEFDALRGQYSRVSAMYLGFLRRAGAPTEIAGWQSFLTAHAIADAVRGFITSPEYTRRF
jgi:hypothetical protein